MIYIMIVVMGLAVFLNRYLFIEPRLPVRLNRGAREFLGFAVPGMLTAICGPIIFLADHLEGLSAIVFAGAAQLVAIGMVKSGASLISIVLTTLLLTSQHLLYGMHMRPTLSALNARWRMSLGFLLTDEFFALVSHYDRETFNRWYALGVGLTFYIAWNLFTLAGIVLGKSIPGLDQLGLEFSIAATFIALITPVVRDVPTVVCVAVSLLFSVWLSFLHWESAAHF